MFWLGSFFIFGQKLASRGGEAEGWNENVLVFWCAFKKKKLVVGGRMGVFSGFESNTIFVIRVSETYWNRIVKM